MPLIYELLTRDEEFRSSAYPDSLGYITIGIGRCIDARKGGGITRDEAEFLLHNDVTHFTKGISATFPEFSTLNEARQAVLISMAFQLGIGGLLSFRNTLDHIRRGDFSGAATCMMASKWAQQVPLRASRLATTMRSGDSADLRLSEDL